MNRQPQNYGAISPVENVDFRGNRHMEFNTLCDNVVTNVYTINSSCKTLDSALKAIGSWKDTLVFRNNIHVTQISTNQIASATSRDIAKLKLLLIKGDKRQQLQVEKLEENFKEAINSYHGIQRALANKHKSHLPVTSNVPLEQEEEEELQRQAQMMRELGFEQDMLSDREARVRQIEADVLDVNQIMRDLGSLVHEQGETIDTIENNIDHAVGNVEEGNEQLIKASTYQNKYRKKLLILALVGFLIAVILIIILVVEFKKK